MSSRLSLVSVLITALLVALAGTAHAATFSVTNKNHFFCCTNPLAFIAGEPAAKQGKFTDVPGVVSQFGVGSPPPSIMIGAKQLFSYTAMAVVYNNPPSFKYRKANFDVGNGAGVLKKGGGNTTTFEFCPGKAGPPVNRLGITPCTNPAGATPSPFNGRFYIKPGANQFGGTLQILEGPLGIGGTKGTVWRWQGGVAMSDYPALVAVNMVDLEVVGAMAPGAALFVKNPACTIAVAGGTCMAIPDVYVYEHGAGPFTTGTVVVSVSQNGKPPIRTASVMGYDNRTAMGAGNIQLVSGLIFNSKTTPGSVPLAWEMNLPEPSASLGLPAGALALLGIGLLGTRRRR